MAPLSIQIAATRPCFLKISADGQKRLERLLETGEHEAFEVTRELTLTAGDAGALKVTLNGAPARPLGKTGDVVTVRITQANFKGFLAAR